MARQLAIFTLLTSLSVPCAVHAALIDRGGGLIYDDVLNVTWLQDANYAMTSGYDADGRMTWLEANAWAENLSYGGYHDWRLPTMLDTGTPGCNFAYSGTDCGPNVQTVDTGTDPVTVYSELAYMYYVNLDNIAYLDTSGNPNPQPGYGLVDDPLNPNDESLFVNLEFPVFVYWSGVEYALDSRSAWYFVVSSGVQTANDKSNRNYAWAVRSGDVITVPEPTSLLLLGLGLASIGVMRRRRFH